MNLRFYTPIVCDFGIFVTNIFITHNAFSFFLVVRNTNAVKGSIESPYNLDCISPLTPQEWSQNLQ